MKFLLLILFMFPVQMFTQSIWDINGFSSGPLHIKLKPMSEVKVSVTVSKYKTLVCDKSPFTIRDTNRMRQRLPD